MIVKELLSGMVFRHAGREAVVIAHAPHPDYDGFELVIWKLDDETFSFDALSPIMELPGQLVTTWSLGTPRYRGRELLNALKFLKA